MPHGQTWGSEEMQALIDIWSEGHISLLLYVSIIILLVATHKNNE